MNLKQGYFAEMLSIKLHCARRAASLYAHCVWMNFLKFNDLKEAYTGTFCSISARTVAENRALFRVWINL